MVFVFTFAVGGGSGNVIDMPNWALVRRVSFSVVGGRLFGTNVSANRIPLATLTTA